MTRCQTPPHRRTLSSRLALRATQEQGFTLIEVVVVVLILGILTSVAIPAYLQLSERADRSAATTNVRAVVSDVEAYYSDNGTFDGISATVLHNNYDVSVDTTLIWVESVGGTLFMLCSKSGDFYGWKYGPADTVHATSTRPDHCSV